MCLVTPAKAKNIATSSEVARPAREGSRVRTRKINQIANVPSNARPIGQGSEEGGASRTLWP